MIKKNMKTLEQIKNVLKSQKQALREKYHVARIGVFGSYVRGDHTPASDLDILIELAKPLGWEIVDLHDYLEKILETKVDLVTQGAVVRKELLWKSIQEDLIHV